MAANTICASTHADADSLVPNYPKRVYRMNLGHNIVAVIVAPSFPQRQTWTGPTPDFLSSPGLALRHNTLRRNGSIFSGLVHQHFVCFGTVTFPAFVHRLLLIWLIMGLPFAMPLAQATLNAARLSSIARPLTHVCRKGCNACTRA